MINDILITAIVSPVTIGGLTVGGVILLAFVWGKIRPVIKVNSKNGGKFFFGVSHSSKRKNMSNLTQEGIEGITTDEDTCYGLSNTPSKIIKEVGTVSVDKAQELLDSVEDKKVKKIEKRKGTKEDE